MWLRRLRPYLLGLLVLIGVLYAALFLPLPPAIEHGIVVVLQFLLRVALAGGALLVQSPVLGLLYDVWMGLLIVSPALPMMYGQMVQVQLLMQAYRPIIAHHTISPAQSKVLERRWRWLWRGWMRDAQWLREWCATIHSLQNLRQFTGIAPYIFPSNRSLQTVSA